MQECLFLNGAQYENTNASKKELQLTETFSIPSFGKVKIKLSNISYPVVKNLTTKLRIVCLTYTVANHLDSAQMRPVPTKWETSRKISSESYKQIHDIRTLSFKMIYNMPGLLPYLGFKPIISLRNSFVFYWFLKCSISHISFSSLATCRSFCENRSQMFCAIWVTRMITLWFW